MDKHEGALKATDVKSCLDPSSVRLVSGNMEQEGGGGGSRKEREDEGEL